MAAQARARSGRTAPIAGPPARIYVNGRFLQQPATGVQRYARELLKAWDKLLAQGQISDADFVFEVLAPRGPIDVPRLDRIAVRQVGVLRGHLWTQMELPFFARDGLLFSPGNIHPLVSLGRSNGVVTVHDLAYAVHPEAYSRTFRLLYSILVPAALRRADAVITVSESEKDHILSRYPCANGRIHAIHHGAPNGSGRDSHSRDQDGPLERIPFVLWVGTFIARKNAQGAIDAMALVNRETAVDLVAVGGTQKGLLDGELRIDPDMRDRVHLLGRVSGLSELRRLYKAAVALVFPSFYEGFGIPPLEAMSFGCPVIAADIPVLREVCGEAALYADPHEPADIARQLSRLLNDPGLHVELRQRGLRRSAAFTWEKCARETLDVLWHVLAREGAQAGTP